MDKTRSSNMAVEMPTSRGAGPLVLGRDPLVPGVHYQVARCLNEVLNPLNIMASGVEFLDEKTL